MKPMLAQTQNGWSKFPADPPGLCRIQPAFLPSPLCSRSRQRRSAVQPYLSWRQVGSQRPQATDCACPRFIPTAAGMSCLHGLHKLCRGADLLPPPPQEAKGRGENTALMKNRLAKGFSRSWRPEVMLHRNAAWNRPPNSSELEKQSKQMFGHEVRKLNTNILVRFYGLDFPLL